MFIGTATGFTLSAPEYDPAETPGLTGYFHDGKDFQTFMASAVDSTVNFNPADTTIGVNRAGGGDLFSAYWIGQVKTDDAGTYTFYTYSDDGVRLSVNNSDVITNWTDHGATENSGTISLEGGRWYPISLFFYDNTGGSVITLSYKTPSGSKQIIPSTRLGASGGSVYYEVNWGDESPVERVPASGYVNPSSLQSVNHTYNSSGAYAAQARAINEDGAASGWQALEVGCGTSECSGAGYSCQGSDLYYTTSYCQTSFVQSCVYGCTGSFPNAQCVVPPGAQFAPFTAFLPGSLGGGQFQASGELEARPTLVRQGESTQLYWNTVDTEVCSVIGTNGFSSSATSSGQNGQVSGAINEQTIFTLDCTGFDGEPISDQAIVNIIPVVQEK